MPEGDTIATIANRMTELVVGKPVAELFVRHAGVVTNVRGQTVTAVGKLGKHMIIEFEGGLCVRVHLGIAGRWRLFSADKPLPSWTRVAPVRLSAGDHVVVCARAREVEVLPRATVRAHRALRALGPDLLAERFSYEEVAARLAGTAQSGRRIAEVLLDQRIAAGIGNVYKSEVCFLESVHPFTTLGALPADKQRALFERARALLQQNVGPGPRVTVSLPERRVASPRMEARYWVYGRQHQPCLACKTLIEMERTGDDARPTFFCPTCQPPPWRPGC